MEEILKIAAGVIVSLVVTVLSYFVGRLMKEHDESKAKIAAHDTLITIIDQRQIQKNKRLDDLEEKLADRNREFFNKLDEQNKQLNEIMNFMGIINTKLEQIIKEQDHRRV